jgi:hypothetical protein
VYWGHYYLHEGPVGFLSETSDVDGVGMVERLHVVARTYKIKTDGEVQRF